MAIQILGKSVVAFKLLGKDINQLSLNGKSVWQKYSGGAGGRGEIRV
jgi:hypothetical protein